jgi:acyl carrier protein
VELLLGSCRRYKGVRSQCTAATTPGDQKSPKSSPSDTSEKQMSAVAQGVTEIIAAKMKGNRAEVRESDWLDELGIESLEAVEMIFELEDRFGIEIPVNANNTGAVFRTVADVIHVVEELVAKKGAG